MKTNALVLTVFAASAPVFAVENAVPERFPAERYAAMLEKSPFALATPVAAPPAPPEKGFASDWYVTGLGRHEDKDFVSIKSRDLSVSFSLFGDEETNGVTLVGVEWSNERGKSTVTVKKGGEIARIEFNQAELQAAAPIPIPAPGQGQVPGRPIVPGQPAPRPVVTPLQPPPSMNAPGLQGRTAIPRPTGAPVLTQPGAPVLTQPPPLPGGTNTGVPMPISNDAAGGDNRRRIRVINPKQ